LWLLLRFLRYLIKILRKSTYGFRALVLDFCVLLKFPFKIFGTVKKLSNFTSRYLITVKQKEDEVLKSSEIKKPLKDIETKILNHLKL